MTVKSIDEVGAGKTYTELLVAARPAGNHSLPLVVIKGKSPGPTLTIVAGVHPTEYAGIEAALRLARDVSASEVKGRIVIVPFLNIAGFNSRAPGGSPEDLVDVWRVFPGMSGSSITYVVANEVFEKLIKNSDYLVDLHGGELNESAAVPLAWYTVTGKKKTDDTSRAIAKAFSPDLLLDASKIWLDDQPSGLPNGLLIHEAAKQGVPAFIGEAGGAGRSSDEGADRLYAGLLNVARHLGMLKGAAKESQPKGVKDLTIMGVRYDGLLYVLTKAGEKVRKGKHLAEVRSWDGNVLQRIDAPFDGIVTITVNWLPVRSGEYALAMVREAS